MGRPTGIEPVTTGPQPAVITVSPWPPCRPKNSILSKMNQWDALPTLGFGSLYFGLFIHT